MAEDWKQEPACLKQTMEILDQTGQQSVGVDIKMQHLPYQFP